MEGDDDTAASTPTSGGTQRKALWRSASLFVRSSPSSSNTSSCSNPSRGPSHNLPKPNRPSLPPLQPLSISRHSLLTSWPHQSSDDTGHWPHHPPSTPSSSSYATTNHECSRIADHIYLGSDAVARDRDALRRHGITHVLNCVGSACPEYFRGDLTYKTLWLHDSPAEDITSVLYDAFDYLEEVRSHPFGRVFVHCLKGASRSAALVIAYLMWRHAQSFDDALRHVRSARAVTDPNLGFASQLLQCQSRVHALPPSPGSALRLYRMAPHSPYDPLHLVPKSVDRPSPARLDSRGAFLIVHVDSAIFVWLGRYCDSSMAASAAAAAQQVVRYEKVRCPVVTVQEGSESPEFWVVLAGNSATDLGEEGGRKVELYDLDFEIFRRALKGGVVPPVPMPGTVSETCLPARESGWCRVRKKFLHGEFAADDGEEEQREQFRSSPSSVSGDSSATPSGSSLTDTASTQSTFSPKSVSSLDWQNSSPLPSPPPVLVHKLPPLHSRKGKEWAKEMDSSVCTVSSKSLAERRGSTAPSLVLLPPSDDRTCPFSPSDIVRDWCLSPPFIPEVDEERTAMDVDVERPLVSFHEKQEDENVSRDDSNESTCLTHPILFRWPSMDKVEVIHPGALDSKSVFLLLAPNIRQGMGKPKGNVLYMWLGRENRLISHGHGCEMDEKDGVDRPLDLDTIPRRFLKQMGLPLDIPVQIIREEEEPEQFLNHLFSFSPTK